MDLSPDCDETEYHASSVHHSEFVAPGFLSSNGNLNTGDEARLMRWCGASGTPLPVIAARKRKSHHAAVAFLFGGAEIQLLCGE